MSAKPKAETKLVRSILDALALYPHELEAWRWQSGQVKVRGGWMHLAPEGTPDLGGYLRAGARMFAVETKTLDGGDLAPPQVEWRDRFVTAGGLYVGPCRTAEQAVAGLGLPGATANEATLRFVALPVPQRRAIERAVEAGELTHEEIARSLGCSRMLVSAAAMFVRASPAKWQPGKP